MINSDRLLTIREVAELLKVHWQTVRNYIESGKMKAVKSGKSVRILESEVEIFLKLAEKREEKYEIEIRFLTKNRQKIEQNLLRWGAKIVYQGHVIDHWFVPNEIKNIDEKNDYYESGRGYGLRIREQDNGYTGKISTTLENKRLVVPYQHDTCLEAEIGVESYDAALKLLSTMNIKEFCTLEKDRLVYKLDGIKVVLDDIKNFEVGVEIEMVTAEKRESVLPRLYKIAKNIGLDVKSEITDKSVTFLYMQKFAKF